MSELCGVPCFAGNVLLLGGTGAIGRHLALSLASLGYKVFITSRQRRVSNDGQITYLRGDALQLSFLQECVSRRKWTAIVDFMVRGNDDFESALKLFAKYAQQFIYISSYRVFSSSEVLSENSPRLLDVSTDGAYLSTNEYALLKARQEDYLIRHSDNWTICRPGITYAVNRYQLGTLEARQWLWRARRGFKVALPTEMLQKRTVLTSGVDVGEMIARLIGNKNAICEDFIVAGRESRTWSEIADIYSREIGLQVFECDLIDYENALGFSYQMKYDRLCDRQIDNSKIMKFTCMDACDFASPEVGLRDALSPYRNGMLIDWVSRGFQEKMNLITGESLKPTDLIDIHASRYRGRMRKVASAVFSSLC